MTQSRIGSLVEALANVAIGIGIAFVSQLVIFHAYGIALRLDAER